MADTRWDLASWEEDGDDRERRANEVLAMLREADFGPPPTRRECRSVELRDGTIVRVQVRPRTPEDDERDRLRLVGEESQDTGEGWVA